MTRQLTDDLPDTRPDTAPQSPALPRAKLLDLSLTQLLGGSMAAATAAALGSRLGVVGTIAGAAVLSVVSAIAASLYTNSMARAKDAFPLVRSRGGVDVVEPKLVRERWWRRADRTTTRRVLAATAAVFAIAAAFLTGVQLTTGAQVTGTDLGGRASAGAVVDSPAAPRAEQAPQDGRVTGSSGSSRLSDGATPSPSATAPAPQRTTGAVTGPATVPASTPGATPASTGTPAPSSTATPSDSGPATTPAGATTPSAP